MGLVKSQRHETSLYCTLMYTKCLQRIAILLVGLTLFSAKVVPAWAWAYRSVGRFGKYNALDASFDFQNYQLLMDQEMHYFVNSLQTHPRVCTPTPIRGRPLC